MSHTITADIIPFPVRAGVPKRASGQAPAQAQPRPAQPRPAQPRPAQPRPAQPRPAQSRPAQSRPAQSHLAQPHLAQPHLAQPDNTRLAQAMASLNAALAEQSKALAGWRAALADLKTSAKSLGDGFHQYQGSLEALDSRVSALRSESARLNAWADGVLTRDGKVSQPP